MDKQKFEGEADMLLALSRVNLSQRNYFIDSECSRFRTVKEMVEFNDGKLPYTLEDIAHNARQFIDHGIAPEQAFAIIVNQNGIGTLLQAVAMTIARQVEAKAKSAKAGR